MEEKIFQDCLNEWKNSKGSKKYWPELAKKYGYSDGEKIRSQFKHEREKRGIKKDSQNIVEELRKSGAVIGVLDIEMLPAISFSWGLFDQNIAINQVIEDVCLLSWAGKYLNDSKMYSDVLTPKEAIARNPERIAQSAWEFVNSCNFLIGHNFRSYDSKHLNSAFLLYCKPVKYQIIDTLEIAKNNFKFMSNKLKFINDKLGIRNKIENEGFPLWRACSEGQKSSLDTMLEYNIGDIIATENLYYKLRPFMAKHPNLAKFNEIETEQCPVCTSESLTVEGRYDMYESVRCDVCGALSRRKVNLLTKNKRKVLLVSN